MHGHLEKELNHLQEKLVEMATCAETSVRLAIHAFKERNLELATRVRNQDQLLDAYEIAIDDLAVQILLRAPLASDLRFVMATMKISQNLERIGDEAAKIAKRARDLSLEPPPSIDIDLSNIVDPATEMLHNALNAFIMRDPKLARTTLPVDQQVDAIHKAIRHRLIEHMKNHPEEIPQCLDILTAVKCLERIADHATNICEDVVYMCEAQDIRHQPKPHTTTPKENTV